MYFTGNLSHIQRHITVTANCYISKLNQVPVPWRLTSPFQDNSNNENHSPRIAERGYNGNTLKTIFKIPEYYSSVLVVTSRTGL